MRKKSSKGKVGGAREGAGRKESGRKPYLTRLRQDQIGWIHQQAEERECPQCIVVEEAIDEKKDGKPISKVTKPGCGSAKASKKKGS